MKRIFLGVLSLLVWGCGSSQDVSLLSGPSGTPGAQAQGASLGFEATGADRAAIEGTVNRFRTALGANNGVGGSFPGGLREINWDGVPATAEDPHPANFFNTTSPRGVVFSTPGSRLKVSGSAGTPAFLFGDVTAQQWGLIEFATFSSDKLFAPIGDPRVEVRFFVPGTTKPATTQGFGAVFVDVDKAQSSFLEYYSAQNLLIARQFVSPSGVRSKGLTFTGILASRPIARVLIQVGEKPIDTPFADPPPDGVCLDDLIYGEPMQTDVQL